MSTAPTDQRPRVPPSAALGQTLQRTVDYARHQSHRVVTVEHLLLALCEDPDAGRVLSASVDVRQVMMDVAGFVGRIEDRAPPHQPVEPVFDPELVRIMEYASVATQQSGRGEINGAIVLAAIVGDERSPSATILRSQGLTFEEAILILRQTSRQPMPASEPQPPPPRAGLPPPMPEPQPPALPAPPSWPDPVQDAAHYAPYPSAQPPAHQMNGQVRHSAAVAYDQTYDRPYDAQGYAGGHVTEAPPPDYRRPPAQPTPPPRRDARPAPPVLPLTEIDADRLAELLPERIRRGQSETIELSVPRADIANLGVSFGSPGGATRPDMVVGRSLTMRLRSADGRVVIEPVTPETQWIDARDVYTTDDLSWRWTIVGLNPGKAGVTLSVAARTIAIDGIAVESALPDQVHSLRVTKGWARQGGRLVTILLAMAVGAALAMSGSLLVDLLIGVLRRGR